MRALVVALAALAAACGRPSPSEPGGAPVTLTLPSDTGDLVTIPIAGARATVVDFFGPWCEPCATSVPDLVARRADIEHSGARLVFVAVLAEGEETADAMRSLEKWGARTTFLVDNGEASLHAANVSRLPSTLILDEAGRVTWRVSSPARAADVLAALR